MVLFHTSLAIPTVIGSPSATVILFAKCFPLIITGVKDEPELGIINRVTLPELMTSSRLIGFSTS